MIWAAPVLSFLVTVAFWGPFQGAATSPRWAVAALTLYWLHWACLPFLAFCFWRLDFDQAVHWSIVCAALSLGAKLETRTYQKVVWAFCGGIAVSSVLAIAQTQGWQGIPQAAAPAGLFVNKNVMADAAVLAFVAGCAVASQRLVCETGQNRRWGNLVWWSFPLMTLPAIALSGGRAAQLGALCGMFFLLPVRARLWLGLFTALIMWQFWSELLLPHLSSFNQRVSLWNDAVQHLTWLGNGSYDFSTAQHREPNLHNDWLQAVYELGVVGVVVPALFIVAGRNDAALPVVVVLAVIGSFSFPLHVPASGWFAAVVVGFALRRRAIDGRTVVPTRRKDWKLSGFGRRPALVSLSTLYSSRPRA